MAVSLRGKRVWVAGHRGLVGSALVRRLTSEDCEVLTATRAELDLRRQADTEAWVKDRRPQIVFVAAAKVGGILANSTFPADFLHDNLALQTNVLTAARDVGVEKLVFLGSSCIYPKLAPQPIVESSLLSGPLEPTNEWYAIAKIAGLKLAEAFRRQHGCDFVSAMPTNMYGPGDNYDLAAGHLMAALIRKAHEAKVAGAATLTLWGTGTPRREYLHSDDAADAIVHIAKHYSDFEHINAGSGEDRPILEIARLVAQVVGFEGEIVHDLSKPDGTPRKLMDGGKLRALGWAPSISLEAGVQKTYEVFLRDVAPGL